MKNHMVRPVTSFSRTIRLCSVLLIATLTLGQWRSSAKNPAQDVNQPHMLTPGVPVESEITAGQSLTWRIILSAGDYLRLLVDVNGGDQKSAGRDHLHTIGIPATAQSKNSFSGCNLNSVSSYTINSYYHVNLTSAD